MSVVVGHPLVALKANAVEAKTAMKAKTFMMTSIGSGMCLSRTIVGIRKWEEAPSELVKSFDEVEQGLHYFCLWRVLLLSDPGRTVARRPGERVAFWLDL